MCSPAPLFSILVPVYNAQEYLEDCLSSIVAQSYSDYEVILVDDGSTDGSGDLCDGFSLRHNSVKVVHQENRGLLLARRTAMRQASGDYIVNLDADDVLRFDALEWLARVVAEQRPDIIVFRYTRLSSFEVCPTSGLQVAPGYYAGDQYALYQHAVCDGQVISMWTKCYKRSVAGLCDDYSRYRGITYAEDLIQSVRLAEEATSFFYLNEALYYYRPNPKACTSDYRPEYLVGLMIGIDAQIGYASGLTPELLRLARVSALRQVMGLVRILLDSTKSNGEKITELKAIGKRVGLSGLFGSWRIGLGRGDRLRASALEHGHYRFLLIERKLVQIAKAVLCR